MAYSASEDTLALWEPDARRGTKRRSSAPPVSLSAPAQRVSAPHSSWCECAACCQIEEEECEESEEEVD
jgi:hypothetical protein